MKGKGYGIFYIAQYPVRWTAQSTLHYYSSPDRPVHSDTNSTSLGSILVMQQLLANTIFTHISTAVYTQLLIYTAERTDASWRERKCPIFQTVAKGDSNPGSLDCESGILPLSYCSPQRGEETIQTMTLAAFLTLYIFTTINQECFTQQTSNVHI